MIVPDNELKTEHYRDSVVTIGNFDGVHRGHQALVSKLAERADVLGGPAIVYTFDPHPLRVLNPSACPPSLTDFEQKSQLLDEAGADVVVRARFDREYAARPAEWFASDVLAGLLGAAEVWIGPDFAFGKGRKGDKALLSRVGADEGYEVHTVEPFIVNGDRVSSTRVRAAIKDHDFALAGKLLGRPWALHGPVVKGRGRGRELGFPTANLLPREECVPPPGVYAAKAYIDGSARWLEAAVNVGRNPTFAATDLTVEAFLPGFDADLYGSQLRLEFVDTVRGEIAFASAEALAAHIARDVEEVRSLLAEKSA